MYGIALRLSQLESSCSGLTPESLKSTWSQGSVSRRVVYVLVAQPILNQPGVVTFVCQEESAAVPELVEMDWKFQTSDFAELGHGHVCSSCSQWKSKPR